jgi:hypothetical protein
MLISGGLFTISYVQIYALGNTQRRRSPLTGLGLFKENARGVLTKGVTVIDEFVSSAPVTGGNADEAPIDRGDVI